MWLLVNDATGIPVQVLCKNQDDALQYINLHRGIWTVSIVDVWERPEPKTKSEAKLGRDFKPMSQD